MSVSSVSSALSTMGLGLSTAQSGTKSSGNATNITQEDSFEMSSASKSGGNSACPQGNTVCIGCGSCTSSTKGNTNATVLAALSAYETQSKLF